MKRWCRSLVHLTILSLPDTSKLLSRDRKMSTTQLMIGKSSIREICVGRSICTIRTVV